MWDKIMLAALDYKPPLIISRKKTWQTIKCKPWLKIEKIWYTVMEYHGQV